MKTILITRPADEAKETAAGIERAGFKVISSPMLDVRPLSFARPGGQDLAAALLTSPRAARFAGSPLCSVAYVVGVHTADAARAAGYKDVREAGGTGAALAERIAQDYAGQSARFVHVRGREVAFDLAGALEGRGHRVEPMIVYETVFAGDFRPEALAALNAGKVDGVALFSKRTAENFIQLMYRHKLWQAAAGIKILCISDAVLEYVQLVREGESGLQVYASETPDRAGLLALMRQQCSD